MKPIITLLLLCLPLTALAQSIDTDRFLAAIQQIEQTDHQSRGRAGEFRFGITPAVLRQHGYNPATVTEYQVFECAARHVGWITQYLEARHWPVNAQTTALCWVAGAHGATSGKATMAAFDYSHRVQNIYAQ